MSPITNNLRFWLPPAPSLEIYSSNMYLDLSNSAQYGNEVDLQQAAQTIVPNQYNQPVTLGSMIAQQRQAAASGSPTTSPGTSGLRTTAISPARAQELEDAGASSGIAMSDGERQQLQQQMQQVSDLKVTGSSLGFVPLHQDFIIETFV